MVNAILAKRVNHIVTKGDNPAWPKGSKSRGFSIRFISEHGPACSGFVCDNQKLQKFVISHIPENGREVYQEQLDRTREVQTEHRQNAVVLKKEASYQPAQENRNTLIGLKPVFTGMLIVGILLVLVVIWRRKKR